MSKRLAYLGNCGWLLGPLTIALSTILLVAHATSFPLAWAGVILFFAGVTTAYTLDYLIDHPAHFSPVLAGVTILAIAAGIYAAFWLPIWKIFLAAALGSASLAYRDWKKWPLVKNLVVATAWTSAGLALPVSWPLFATPSIPFTLALFATFAANAVLCDLKDRQADTQMGVGSAVVMWGEPATIVLATSLALTGTVAALLAQRPGLAGAGLALGILAAFPRCVSHPVLGPALVDCALILPAIFILAGLA